MTISKKASPVLARLKRPTVSTSHNQTCFESNAEPKQPRSTEQRHDTAHLASEYVPEYPLSGAGSFLSGSSTSQLPEQQAKRRIKTSPPWHPPPPWYPLPETLMKHTSERATLKPKHSTLNPDRAFSPEP